MNGLKMTWAQEACIYLFVRMAKFGAAYEVRTGIHVGVDVLAERLEGTSHRTITTIAMSGGVIFTAILTWIRTDFVWHVRSRGRYRPIWKCRCGSLPARAPGVGADVFPLHSGAGPVPEDRQRRPALRIVAILALLLITGMPVSIALGLTVVTFFFGFSDVALDAIALKRFTGIEKFEIMAIPCFILAGNFLTHGGVARRMIRPAS